jgi:hypothetical protein
MPHGIFDHTFMRAGANATIGKGGFVNVSWELSFPASVSKSYQSIAIAIPSIRFILK